ncbi:MAG TPA: hypothetical protein VFC07_06400 [Verrucomicrobiae bacterium]|nr:hypothetical protein [Verrucomicrobiae bacterium]
MSENNSTIELPAGLIHQMLGLQANWAALDSRVVRLGAQMRNLESGCLDVATGSARVAARIAKVNSSMAAKQARIEEIATQAAAQAGTETAFRHVGLPEPGTESETN